MHPIKIKRRFNWRGHIKANAYQVDALGDPELRYWTEALETPYAVQFSEAEEEALIDTTEALWEMSCEFLDRFFTEETPGAVGDRLTRLDILPEYSNPRKG